jgi:hypothetical protein
VPMTSWSVVKSGSSAAWRLIICPWKRGIQVTSWMGSMVVVNERTWEEERSCQCSGLVVERVMSCSICSWSISTLGSGERGTAALLAACDCCCGSDHGAVAAGDCGGRGDCWGACWGGIGACWWC